MFKCSKPATGQINWTSGQSLDTEFGLLPLSWTCPTRLEVFSLLWYKVQTKASWTAQTKPQLMFSLKANRMGVQITSLQVNSDKTEDASWQRNQECDYDDSVSLSWTNYVETNT